MTCLEIPPSHLQGNAIVVFGRKYTTTSIEGEKIHHVFFGFLGFSFDVAKGFLELARQALMFIETKLGKSMRLFLANVFRTPQRW